VLTELRLQSTADGKSADVKLAGASADHSQEGFPIASVLDAKRKNKKNSGWAVLPQIGKAHEAVFEFDKPLAAKAGTLLTLTLNFQSQHPQHSIGKLRLSFTTAPDPARKTVPPKCASRWPLQPTNAPPRNPPPSPPTTAP